MSIESATHRTGWITSLFDLTEQEQCHEIRQMLVDVLDVVEQNGLEESVLAAIAAFDEDTLVRNLHGN